MEDKILEAKAALQILKPVNEVFEAIVDPVHMCNYFISYSSGRMEEGKILKWGFPEFEGEFPVRVGRVVQDELIEFYWEHENREHLVKIELTPYKGDATVVSITEKGEPITDKGIAWAIGNTEGWANFLACLKAWIEYSIKLRNGAFNFRFDKL